MKTNCVINCPRTTLNDDCVRTPAMLLEFMGGSYKLQSTLPFWPTFYENLSVSVYNINALTVCGDGQVQTFH